MPAGAQGAKQSYRGGAVSLVVTGKNDKRDRLVPNRVRILVTATTDATTRCYDTGGKLMSTTTSPWLYPTSGTAPVSRSGDFTAQFSVGDSITTVTGRIGRSSAKGTLKGQSGQVGSPSTTYCEAIPIGWSAGA